MDTVMNNKYLVIMLDNLDSLELTTECNNEEELARLLANYDKDKYSIIRIDCLGPITDMITFIRHEEGLEQG